jgi:hypothetical protein
MFPLGDLGWTYTEGDGGITLMDWASARLHVRQQGLQIDRFGRLYLQYICDQYSKMQESRLMWVKNNQQKIRADKYGQVQDALNRQDGSLEDIGTRVILPSSFVGSPRYMGQLLQDSLAIVRKRGKPAFFLTMTCNPHWREIQEQLRPGQTAWNRPDLVARVFQLKLKQVIHEILKEQLFGEVRGFIYVIEYQKRGVFLGFVRC